MEKQSSVPVLQCVLAVLNRTDLNKKLELVKGIKMRGREIRGM